MKNEFIRNSVLFSLMLIICVGGLVTFLYSENKKLERGDNLVDYTYIVITEAKELSAEIEAMLSAQRGFLLSADDRFLSRYEIQKAQVSESLATLSELTKNNASHTSRLDEIRNYFNTFSLQLEQRAKETDFDTIKAGVLEDVDVIAGVKNDIIRINNTIINEEYKLLHKRVQSVEEKRDQYYVTMVIGGLIGTIIILMFNAFLLRSQSRRGKLETSLKDSEERFTLAVEGTQDGIFDWNINTGEVFYSKQYFKMLGIDRPSYMGNYDDFVQHLHPDDKDKVEEYVALYLGGNLSEYSNIFRMKHAGGRWIWINARAKIILDKAGKPLRMVGAHTDVSAMREYQDKLREEKEQAQQANRAKSDFLAHMSHEIRTPLTTISGIATILEEKREELSEKMQPLTRTLSNSSTALKDLITDILDFSKIESDELVLESENFLLSDLFEEVISMMSMRANEKNIEFKFEYNDLKEVKFYGDKTRLRQILINLINNALKFTKVGGVIVEARADRKKNVDVLNIAVSDTGIGIEESNQDIIFERFKQADSSVSRKYGGTGLGLPISMRLAKLMGGDIALQSEVGNGSVFTLRVPMKSSQEKVQNDGGLDKKINDKIRANLNGEDKVLIVEDYDGNIVVLTYILDDLGLKYDVAKTGLEALNLWKENFYSLILMDVQMPEMDGFTATKSMRKIEGENNIDRTPIIGMTAHALVGDKDKCIECGMDNYLPKPLVEDDLKELIFQYIKINNEDAA